MGHIKREVDLEEDDALGRKCPPQSRVCQDCPLTLKHKAPSICFGSKEGGHVVFKYTPEKISQTGNMKAKRVGQAGRGLANQNKPREGPLWSHKGLASVGSFPCHTRLVRPRRRMTLVSAHIPIPNPSTQQGQLSTGDYFLNL